MKAIELSEIFKNFAKVRAVDSLSFSVRGGEIFGLLGPNGAGKTTTIRMMMNIIYPDSGEILIFGERLSEELKERIGYLPEERGFYKRMKVSDVLTYFGTLKNMERNYAKKRAEELLEEFEMEKYSQSKVQELSKGNQQKLQFLSTILHDPDLIILDEPFAGLDPVNTKFLKDRMIELQRRGKTIVLSTHQMDQVERLCKDICLINEGKMVLYGNLLDIKKKYGRNSIVLRYKGDLSFLKENGVKSIEDYGNYAELHLRRNAKPQKILEELIQGIEIHKFEVTEPSLNEIFIDVVSSDE
ncbi:MAG: ABC transporter ATP-binding protein [Candidatus Methanofastidiosia archaeon]